MSSACGTSPVLRQPTESLSAPGRRFTTGTATRLCTPSSVAISTGSSGSSAWLGTTRLIPTSGTNTTGRRDSPSRRERRSLMASALAHPTRACPLVSTTATWGETLIITVPRRSELIFYQKRFDFTDVITFVNDAWGKEWNIGSWGSYAPLATKITAVQIMAEEYFTRDATADTVPHIIPPSYVRKRENVTQRARNLLTDMGLCTVKGGGEELSIPLNYRLYLYSSREQ
ncbi:hypothetical protein B0H16DRAFT_1583124 [Mycena metata]|uniref:Uncharacterized protein n=1 Tax=Mycena metata TaxID=1033252 RepID=A0AAD7I181_9AGAR|nr:hypothetical protein B0H16DRAFT_1583124 [Mycena metata]